MERTHHCAAVGPEDLDSQVVLCAWVASRRDLGGVLFLRLRDHSGELQAVIEPEQGEVFERASSLRAESCVRVSGRLRERPEQQRHTGRFELAVGELEVLSLADPLPYDENAGEDTRLAHRYLELRKPRLQRNLRLRHSLSRSIRRYLDEQGFVDVETPILTRATPEGARDYLVPSRVHKGSCYALPQSPQLFKQLLMIGGCDRYYQIARCFRDEDLRADRQPEFTQLDLEMAFVSEVDVMELAEELVRAVFEGVADISLVAPFPVLGHGEALERFGSDKPDLRIGMELVSLDSVFAESDFRAFADAARLETDRVVGMCVPEGASRSRKQLDELEAFVRELGAAGLVWGKVESEGATMTIKSPVAKFWTESEVKELLSAMNAKPEDLLLLAAGPRHAISTQMGSLRLHVGRERGELSGWKPLWITDFPMFERDDDSGVLEPLHHPFTAPAVSLEELESAPEQALSRAYDLVVNGVELGGGSIRIHNSAMQRAVLSLLGIGEQAANEQFGFLLDALRFGAPPHGGIAFGLDRWAAMLAGTDSIREVMAFPKTTTAQDRLTGAPGQVSEEQLSELGLQRRQRS